MLSPAMNILKAEDTSAPLDLFKKNGYYLVGNKIFNHKIRAFQYATKVRQGVSWEFNSAEFKAIDWQQRLGVDIQILYRMRAQQLRAKYRYLVLAWSGGGDSSTILWTFLNNGIPLDEIVVVWPVTASAGRYTVSKDTSSHNMMSEWDLSIKPQIDKIKSLYPNQKITVVDMLTDDLDIVEDTEETLLLLRYHNFFSIKKYRCLDSLIEKRVDQYHDVATIMGISPVDLTLYDDWLCTVINDQFTIAPSDHTSRTIRNLEFFYWTPDFPELIREQAHVMVDHFRLCPKDLTVIGHLKFDRSSSNHHAVRWGDGEAYRHLRKRLLYPDYDAAMFQTAKPKIFYDEIEWASWFFQHPHAQTYLDPWRSCVKTNQNILGDEFLTVQAGKITAYQTFTKTYAVANFKKEIELLETQG